MSGGIAVQLQRQPANSSRPCSALTRPPTGGQLQTAMRALGVGADVHIPSELSQSGVERVE